MMLCTHDCPYRTPYGYCGQTAPCQAWIVVSGKCGKNTDKRIVRCPVCGNYLDMRGVNAGRGDANYCPNCGTQLHGYEPHRMNERK